MHFCFQASPKTAGRLAVDLFAVFVFTFDFRNHLGDVVGVNAIVIGGLFPVILRYANTAQILQTFDIAQITTFGPESRALSALISVVTADKRSPTRSMKSGLRDHS
jgi:hypothetical protein